MAGKPKGTFGLFVLLCCFLLLHIHRADGITLDNKNGAVNRALSNMNGDYIISNAVDSALFDGNYAARPSAEYFDVYSPPITTQYGEVILSS